jgi:hypothetical protein
MGCRLAYGADSVLDLNSRLDLCWQLIFGPLVSEVTRILQSIDASDVQAAGEFAWSSPARIELDLQVW